MYAQDASIVLLGFRGCGKTTLAIIAQAFLGFQHIDADDAFYEATGITGSDFRREFGAQESRLRWCSFLTDLLTKNSRNCLIVWPKDHVEEAGLSVLKKYSNEHPVILVQRDIRAIERYLQLSDPTKIETAIRLMLPKYRSCSNYEYFNLDEVTNSDISERPSAMTSKSSFAFCHHRPRSLLLKHVEASFVRLLKHIMQPKVLPGQSPAQFSMPQPRATYTYLLTVSLAQILSHDFDVSWLDCGADAVQLEVDLDMKGKQPPLSLTKENICEAFAKLTRTCDKPVVYHINLSSIELLENSRLLYLDLVRHGLRLGTDFATTNLGLPDHELRDLLQLSGGTVMIGDYHDTTVVDSGWTSPARQNILTKAKVLGFHGVRLSQPALSSTDNIEAASFALSASKQQNSSLFIIAFNTGPLGRTSRCLNKILTPVTSEHLRNHRSKFAGGVSPHADITIQQAQTSLYSSFVYDTMRYYVIGLDVSFSLSPIIHNAAYQFFGMPHQMEITSMSTIEDLSRLTDDENFGGLTIAQGFKTALFPRAIAMSNHARNIGAINTLLPVRAAFDYSKTPPHEFWADRNRAGPVIAFYGDNLDWVGIVRCIKRNLSPANFITPSSTALVIGAGGMARAATYALMNLGVRHIILYNRTYLHACTLAEHFSKVELDTAMKHSSTRDIRVLLPQQTGWYDDLAPPTMILSCIPASENSQNQFLLPQAWMTSTTGGVVVDMNYRTLLTPLVRQVRDQADRGWVAVDGLENLLEQASAQFEVFTCRKIPRNLMHIAAFEHYLSLSKEDPEVNQYVECQLRRLRSWS